MSGYMPNFHGIAMPKNLYDPGHAGSFGFTGGDGLGGGKFQGSVCGRCYPVTQVEAKPKPNPEVKYRRNARAVQRDDGAVYRSLNKAAKSNGVSIYQIKRSISEGKTIGGHRWRWLQKGREPYRVKCLETGEEFATLSTLAKALGVARNTLRRRIEDGIPVNGKHYERIR